MDQDIDLTEDEVRQVYDHLQAMMDATSRPSGLRGLTPNSAETTGPSTFNIRLRSTG